MTALLATAPAEAAWPPLARDFFERPTEEVARALLGMYIVSQSANELAVARIVETEAYGGPADRASHARAGVTRRTGPMFGPVGHAYVYLVYGLHSCLNVVARRDAIAGAVLLRSAQPVHGVGVMRARRSRQTDADHRLAAGPARLAQALAVDRRLDGHDLTRGELLWLADGGPLGAVEIRSGPRVGVGYAGAEWSTREWRFWLAANPAVSRR
ncbi:MAG: DNA-3-methyladenine glycosylase [Chloroflexota bacterium]|nr:DNA-3-methyladenine glycosylase [Chloroflexota bacterium]